MNDTRALCPTGCGRPQARGLIMCGVCWFEVPSELKQDVERTWREYARTHRDDDWQAYRRAYGAAVVDSACASTIRQSPVCPSCGHHTFWEGRCHNVACSHGGDVA